MGERAEYERRRQERLAKLRPVREVLRQVENAMILRAAELCHRDRVEMAKVLGLPRVTLYRRLARLKEMGKSA